MSYELFLYWLVPLCWPLGIGALAACISKSRFVLVFTVVVTLLCMGNLPQPRWLSSEDGRVDFAMWTGLFSALIAMAAVGLNRFRNRRSDEMEVCPSCGMTVFAATSRVCPSCHESLTAVPKRDGNS
jgi:hypothetical protein